MAGRLAAALLLVALTHAGWAAAQIAEGQTGLEHPAPAPAPVPESEPCYPGANFTAGDCPNGSCWGSAPNGCGAGSSSVIGEQIVPDKWPGGVDFNAACVEHDYCYRTLGADRAQCDQAFLDDMRAECQQSLGGGGGGGGGGSVVGQAAQALGVGEGVGGGGEANPAVDACNKLAQGYYKGIRSLGQQPFEEDQAEQGEHERRCAEGAA